MKRTLIVSLAAIGLITALVSNAAEGKKRHRETQANVVAYLGVATESVDPAMAKQLKLRKGEGLTVQLVDEKSPAADLIQEDDILKQLDDQILVNPEQLRTLVRMHKPGEEVSVMLIHEGDIKKVSVKLGEREVSPEEEEQAQMQRRMQGMPDDQLLPFLHNFRGMQPWGYHQRGLPGQGNEDAEDGDTGKDAGKGKSDGETKIELTPQDGESSVHVSSSQSMTEDGRTVTLTNTNGDKHLKVTKGGKTVFDGPVNTDAQIKALSGDVKDLYEKLNKGATIKIETKSSGKKSGSVDI